MPSGAGTLGPQQRALAQPHLVERLRAAGVADLRRIAAEIEHRQRRARHVGIEQQVHRPGRLVVGLGGVEDEAVLAAVGAALARQRQPEMERAVAVAVGIDRVGEAMRAVVEGLGEPGAHQLARARQQLAQRVGHAHRRRSAPTISSMRFTPSAALAISARMSPTFCSGKRELRKKIFSVASLVTPASIELGRRDDDAFLEDVRGVGADRAGAHAADVGEMRPAHDEAAAPAVVEDRRQQHLVVGMGDRAARAVAVVVPVEIALAHGVGREVAEHRRRRCRRTPAGWSRPPSRRRHRTPRCRNPSSRG